MSQPRRTAARPRPPRPLRRYALPQLHCTGPSQDSAQAPKPCLATLHRRCSTPRPPTRPLPRTAAARLTLPQRPRGLQPPNVHRRPRPTSPTQVPPPPPCRRNQPSSRRLPTAGCALATRRPASDTSRLDLARRPSPGSRHSLGAVKPCQSGLPALPCQGRLPAQPCQGSLPD
eukprot:scaffold18827_cov117-Isochrysis_galbana.AAC.4